MKKVLCLGGMLVLCLVFASCLFAQGASTSADASLTEQFERENAKVAEGVGLSGGSDTPADLPWPERQEAKPAEEAQPSEIVKTVSVEGNKTIGIATILTKIKTRAGDPYLDNIVTDDIKRLYGTGYFSDIKVDKEPQDGGVRVLFRLTEKPIIEKITFTKTRAFPARTLSLKLKSKKGMFFDQRNLKEDVRIILDLYAKKGLTKATVDHDVTMDKAANKASIHFIVTEGERVKIKTISIVDNAAFADKKIIRVIKTRAAALLTSGYLKEEIVREDMDRIKDFYAGNGFLDAQASYALRELSASRLALDITVTEGKKYSVGEIALSGNGKVLSDAEIFGAMKALKTGGVFTPEKLEEDIASINALYFDKGHIFARVQESTSADPSGKVDIKLAIEEGEIAYVNKINIQGNTRTRDVVIRRELRLNPGDAFDGSKLRRSKERLKNLGYFEEIDYDVQDTDVKNKKDLVVQVKEAKTGSLSFGGGYSTVDQLLAFVEIEQKNFDFTNWPTFTGGGQNLAMRGEIGSVRSNAVLSFTEPWILDYPVSGGFDVYRTQIDRESDVGYAYDERRKGFDLRFGKQLAEFLSAGAVYRREDIKIGDVEEDVSDELKKEVGENTVSSMSFTLTRDSRDNIFSPTRGHLLSGTYEIAGGTLGGDKDFWKLIPKTSYNVPVFGATVLEFRLRAGFSDAYGDSGEVPIYERYFAGGANTIRGYNERKVGPLDPVSGDPVGGESMLVGNIEYTVPVLEFLKVAAFFDSGNVWADLEDFASGGYKSGMGLGLRVKTPIGPINLDYGYPLNDEPGEEERSGKFYFSISRSF